MIKTYYQADIYIMTELYVDNDYNEGCDPKSTCDCGIVETIKADNLEKLKEDLNQRYGEIEHFEDNRYETGYDEVERDGTKVYNMVSIYIYHVEHKETEVKL